MAGSRPIRVDVDAAPQEDELEQVEPGCWYSCYQVKGDNTP